MPIESATPNYPQTCQVRDWRVFAGGYHKGELYTPQRVQRIADNFRRLQGYLTPQLAFGHDRQKRLTQSLGAPSLGRVVGVRATGNGDLDLDLANVPTWVGSQINAGRYPAGSIELHPDIPDPADPSQTIEGPILTGIVLIGGEQPAVKGCDPPHATFADGADVPPNYDPIVAPVAGLSPPAQNFPEPTLCFTEGYSVDHDSLVAALADQGIDVASDPQLQEASDEELQQLLDSVSNQKFSDSLRKKFADEVPDDPAAATGPNGQQFADADNPDAKTAEPSLADLKQQFAAMSDDLAAQKQQLGAVQKFAESLQADKARTEEQQFSERASAAVSKAIREGRLLRCDAATFTAEGKHVLKTRCYSDVKNNAEKAFSAWEAALAKRPKVFTAEAQVDDRPAKVGLNSMLAAMARTGSYLDRTRPQTAASLRSSAK